MAVGDDFIEIKFDKYKSTLIVGANGTGKSSMIMDAISFALFGKAYRNVKKGQLVNSINEKHCLVEVEFRIGKKHYLIRRGIKPNIFEIEVDGVMLDQSSHSRDYQRILEINILKLNHKSFHQVVALGSSSFIPFMNLPAKSRRDVIEDLLDITVFSKMNVLLKEQMQKLRENIQVTQSQYLQIQSKLELSRNHVSKLKEVLDKSKVGYSKEIETLNSEIDKLSSEIKKIQTEVDSVGPEMKERLDAEQDKLSKLETIRAQIKFKHSETQKVLDLYKEHKACPSCSREIPEADRAHHIQTYSEKTAQLEDGLKNIEVTIQTSIKNVHEINAELNKVSTGLLKISDLNQQITRLNNQITNFMQAQTSVDNKELQKTKQEVIDSMKELDAIEVTKKELAEEDQYLHAISELLRDTGIKTKIIRQYLPAMNNLINKYLEVLDFFVLFELDENFNETIKSRHRDQFSYDSFSEGEKQRINLAILFAWRQIANMKNSVNTNLLLLDEVFDASLDADGIENLLKILDTLDDSIRVFIISHKRDLLEGQLDRTLEFYKPQNFTKLKVIV